MENNLQTQKAGDGAQQIQAQQIIINQGITEERARSIYSEMIPQSVALYTQDAYATANNRISKLEEIVMPRLAEIDGALEHFADPAFQIVLRKAQQSAAATEREEDYEMLSELLTCHVQKGEDRKKRAAIHKAIEIVDQVDNDALCALTVSHAVGFWDPLNNGCYQGLSILSNLFSSLMYSTLPNGRDWLDHLELLGAVRLSTYGEMKKLIPFEQEFLNGYACVGIKKDSKDYEHACKLLDEINFNHSSWLIENELLPDYVRLCIRKKRKIHECTVTFSGETRFLNEYEIAIIKKIWELYSSDTGLLSIVSNNFEEMWDGFSPLKTLKLWWDKLPTVFYITQVGNILAHTNAKRCSPNLPDLI